MLVLALVLVLLLPLLPLVHIIYYFITTTTPAMNTSSSSGPSVYHIQMGNSKEHPGIWGLHWEGKDLEKLIHDWLSTFLL